jgi:DNA polymerase (family 10)
MSNQKLSETLYELSVLLAIKGVQFKPQAFERASEAIANLQEGVKDIYKREGTKGLEAIPGIGPGIAERIEEFIKTKKIAEHVRLKKKLPIKIAEIVRVEGVGPKTMVLLYKKLGIKTRAQLERAAKAGRLARTKGLGPKLQSKIIRAIGYLKESGDRALLGDMEPMAQRIAEHMTSWSGVRRAVPCGSLRRMQETIGDLDFIASAGDAEGALRRFVTMPEVESVYSHGENKAMVRLKLGRDADLSVLPEEGWGAALIAWTGSKQHNVQLRKIAKRKGYLLDDYGLFKGERMIAGRTEEEVYAKLGMKWIPPELRTDSGEIEAAIRGALPRLVGYEDIKGDLQIQTDWTDGEHSIEQMAKAAQKEGLEYLAITDHTKALAMTGGLNEKKLRRQMAAIDRLQKKFPKVRILKGSECDILKDGTLDLSDAVLADLDVVGVAIHSHFNLSRKAQTERLVRAMENSHADILFHPTARIINRRAPIDMDMEVLLKTAKRTGTVLEINAYPDRLDLKDEYVRKGVSLGVRFAISTDAHAREHLPFLRYGIAQARRGWAEKKDVINTRNWRQMLKLLKKM